MSGIAFSNAVKNVDLLSFASIETLDLANPIFSSRDLLFSLGRVFLSFPSALTPNKFRMAGSQKKMDGFDSLPTDRGIEPGTEG